MRETRCAVYCLCRVFGDATVAALRAADFNAVAMRRREDLFQFVHGEQGAVLVILDAADNEALSTLTSLRASTPPSSTVRVVVVNIENDQAEILTWADATPEGCVTKTAPLDELLIVLHKVNDGEVAFSSDVATLLLGRQSIADQHLRRLTPREQQIVAAVRRGLSNKQIARELTVEISTVKNHLHSIFRKLAITRRADLMALGLFVVFN